MRKAGCLPSVAALLAALMVYALGAMPALADVRVLQVAPLLRARGVDLAPGDVLAAPGDATLDAWRLATAETTALRTGALQLLRERDGAREALSLPPGRWGLIVVPVLAGVVDQASLDAAITAAAPTAAPPDRAALLQARALLHAGRREFEAAAADFHAALVLAPQHAALLHEAQARAFETHPDRKAPLAAADAAVTARRNDTDRDARAAALVLQAQYRTLVRDNPGADAASAAALALVPDGLNAARAHLIRVFVALRTGKRDQAADELAQAQRLAQAMAPDGLEAAQVRARQALLAAIRREGDVATQAYAEALETYRRLVPESVALAQLATNAHLHALERQRFAEAEALAREALLVFGAAAPGTLEQSQARAALAEVLMRRTEFAEAESLLRESVAASDLLDARSYEALSLRLQLGDCLNRQQRPQDALQQYDLVAAALAAPDLPEAVAATSLAADVQLYRADVLLALAHYGEASTAAAEAVATYEARGLAGAQLYEALLAWSMAERQDGRPEAAEPHARAAVQGYAGIAADGIQLGGAEFELARVLRARGDIEAALASYQRAIDGLEKHRERVGGSDEIRTRWASQYQDFYKEPLQLLAERGEVDAALQIESRYRVQALLKLLGERDAQVPPEWATQVPRAEVQAQLAPDQALLSFVLGTDAGVLFVLRPGAAVPQAFRIAAPRDEIAALVDRLLLLASRPAPDEAARSALLDVAERLYAILLMPALPVLREYPRWVAIGDGPLLQLPWGALLARRGELPHWLVEDHIVSTAASAAVWATLSQRQGGARIVAFADPLRAGGSTASGALRDEALQALPGARAEIDAIADLFPDDAVERYAGAQASEARVRALAGTAGTLHFAVHSIIATEDPLASWIALSPGAVANPRDDGALSAEEIAQGLKLRGALVVLSSCASARGGDGGGEGLLGLVRALQLAGARAVVGTYWPVADRPTAGLMRDFYAGLREGQGSDAALAQAQRAWLAQARDTGIAARVARATGMRPDIPLAAADPFYWAGFGHSGNAAMAH